MTVTLVVFAVDEVLLPLARPELETELGTVSLLPDSTWSGLVMPLSFISLVMLTPRRSAIWERVSPG